MENVSLILQGISTICFFMSAFIIQSFKKSLDNMQISVNNLNVNIATLVQTDKNKEERLHEHKDALSRLGKEVERLREKYHDNTNDLGGRIGMLELTVEDIKNILKER